MTHELQRAVDETFRALEEAEPLSPGQVRAQLRLSQLAAGAGRYVEALAFALAARATAREGGLHGLERIARVLLLTHVETGGWTALSELAAALHAQGVDLYEYIDPGEVIGGALT
ncbi:hypothetical protein J2Z79_000432 [Symbiobacterium terraclitae]|uniref:Uncharacterized protein n=1 Tax=Symbiobacterium terraclitae TaxID=557451 RepID=A0ABS4JNE7_9FIRM|nr:hypothetical protein [Symbiobacterium terraclitae]MBP2017058.1 hypothetical protein [Symbiobacterium terraclitae]